MSPGGANGNGRITVDPAGKCATSLEQNVFVVAADRSSIVDESNG